MPEHDTSPPLSQSTAAELEGCLRDLIALLPFPSLCQARPLHDIVRLLAEAVARVMSAEVVYARLSPPHDQHEHLVVNGAPASAPVREALTELTIERGGTATATLPGLGPVRLCCVPLGFYGDVGQLLVGSTRSTFPKRLELVVAQAAASLGANAVENAQLLAAAQEADRRKDEFLALLGHELRNPLAPIVTALEIMRLRQPDPSREHEIIERQTRHMVQLVDDLMDVARITRGKLELSLETLRAADFVERALELARPLVESRGHTLSVEVPRDLHVHGDLLRLAQVMTNLLTNAAKYTEPGGRIEVEAARDGERVRIHVRDTGRGIDPAVLPTIFDPFIQAGRARSDLAGGLGLGLSLVRSLVTQHGGEVAAHSAGPGEGSTFTVTLPLLAAEAATESAPAKAGSRPAAPGLRVLVVDDNADAAELLGLALDHAGHVVCVAADGPSALEVARTLRPAFAILDLGLPGMDGYTLAGRLRKEHPTLRLAALTGYADERSRRESAEAGFEVHLVKPADIDVLLRWLDAPTDAG